MKLKILLDNYFFYIIFFGVISIFKLIFLNEKISFGLLFILGLLWLSDLIFEKKKYLLNLKTNETHIEITYLDKYLKTRTYSKEKELIKSTNYLKNKSFFNKFEVLQIVEKDSFNVLNFEIIEKKIQEDVQEKIS